MSTGAGDGSLRQIKLAIANCEGFYLQGNTGVDDLASFSAVVPNVIDGAYPFSLGKYEYSLMKPYIIQGNATMGGSSAPIKQRCHYFKRLVAVGSRSDDMENVIQPQIDLWVDYYDSMVSAHQTLQEPKWAATYKIIPNVIIVPTQAHQNGHAYQNLTGTTFTTGGTEPTWNTGSGSTTSDGTGTWTEIRAPWGAVSNIAKVVRAEPFSIVVNEALAHMGVAFTVEASSLPIVTVGL